MVLRREFIIRKIIVNGKSINRVVVDDHVRKHKDVTDDLILELVKQLDGTDNLSDDVKGSFSYFVNLFESDGKQYRIVWLLEKGKLYIGVVTIYRDNRRKK